MPSPRQYTSKDESGNTTKTKIYSCNSLSTAARIIRENGMKVVKKGERENANPVSAAIRLLRKEGYKTRKKDTSASKEAAKNNPFFIYKKKIREEVKDGSLSCNDKVDYTSIKGEKSEYTVGAGGLSLLKVNKQGKKQQQKKQKTGQQGKKQKTQKTKPQQTKPQQTKQQQTKQQQQQKQQQQTKSISSKQQTPTKKKPQPVATRTSGRLAAKNKKN